MNIQTFGKLSRYGLVLVGCAMCAASCDSAAKGGTADVNEGGGGAGGTGAECMGNFPGCIPGVIYSGFCYCTSGDFYGDTPGLCDEAGCNVDCDCTGSSTHASSSSAGGNGGPGGGGGQGGAGAGSGGQPGTGGQGGTGPGGAGGS